MKGRVWTGDEDEFLRSNADSMSGPQIAEHLGRTHAATKQRARKLGLHIPNRTRFSSDLFMHANGQIQIGSRLLIAKTCKTCGRLLPARRFQRFQSGRMRGCWHPSCKSCVSSQHYAANPERSVERTTANLDKLQEYTKSLAFAQGTPWSAADLDLVRDTSKSLIEVAVTAGRTYAAVQGRASKEGVHRRINPEQHKNWIVQLQRASVEAALQLEPMDSAGIPREEDWDWNDDEQVAS